MLEDLFKIVKTRSAQDIKEPGSKVNIPSNLLFKCPRCGKPVYEGKKSFYCSGYRDDPPCSFSLWKENPYFKSKRKELTKQVAAALLKDGRVKMTGLYSEKKGGTYDATIVMEDTGDRYVNFRLEFPPKKSGKKAA